MKVWEENKITSVTLENSILIIYHKLRTKRTAYKFTL